MAEHDESAHGGDMRQVLVVDDDITQRELLDHHLRSAGYSVLTATNGREAMQLLMERMPKIAIVDWEMPGMSGLELCRAIREQQSELGYVYLIMLTIHSDKPRLVEALDAGADDFLSKPFDHGELLGRMRAGLRMIGLQFELDRRVTQAARLNAELAATNAKLHAMAVTDELTGLPNRRQALADLEQAFREAVQHDRAMVCAMFDLDHFKDLNDAYGHEAGDQVLREVGAVLQKTMPADSAVYRLGGEEFMMILRHVDAVAAAVAIDRCRQAVRRMEVRVGDKTIMATVSAGVAQLRQEHHRAADVLRHSDNALYAAKRAGRDRVLTNDGLTVSPTMAEG